MDHAHLPDLAAVDGHDRGRLLADVDEHLGDADGTGAGGHGRVDERGGLELDLVRLEPARLAGLDHPADRLLRNGGREQLARILHRLEDLEVDDDVVDVELRKLALDLELDDLLDLVGVGERELDLAEGGLPRLHHDPQRLLRRAVGAGGLGEHAPDGGGVVEAAGGQLARREAGDLRSLGIALEHDQLVASGSDPDSAGLGHSFVTPGGSAGWRRTAYRIRRAAPR